MFVSSVIIICGYHGILLLGKLLKYIDGKWRQVAMGDKLQLTKTEAQVFNLQELVNIYM